MIETKKIKTITSVSSVFFILLAAAVSLVINYSKFSFLIGTVNSNELIIIFAAFAAICLAVSTITAIASKQEKHMVLKSIIRVLIICVIVYFALISNAFNRSCDYYEFTSPDGKYTVIAEEWSYLLGGGVNFYERINPLLVMQKEDFTTDDGYRAISSGDYSVEWNENVMDFTVQNGNGIYKTLKIEMNNKNERSRFGSARLVFLQ